MSVDFLSKCLICNFFLVVCRSRKRYALFVTFPSNLNPTFTPSNFRTNSLPRTQEDNIFVYLSLYIHTHIYLYIYSSTYVCVYIYIYLCVYLYMSPQSQRGEREQHFVSPVFLVTHALTSLQEVRNKTGLVFLGFFFPLCGVIGVSDCCIWKADFTVNISCPHFDCIMAMYISSLPALVLPCCFHIHPFIDVLLSPESSLQKMSYNTVVHVLLQSHLPLTTTKYLILCISGPVLSPVTHNTVLIKAVVLFQWKCHG